MALLETFEVWLPMPGQDGVPIGQQRRYLLRTFSDEGDALAAARDASGGAVTKTTYYMLKKTQEALTANRKL